MTGAAGRFDPRRSEPIDGGHELVVWDPRSRTGLIERDRVGTRPLFFAESGGALLFASELAQLRALLPRRPAPDETAMAHWLAGTVPNDGRTLYEGVRRLAPGDALALGADGWTYVRRQGFRYREPADVHAGEAAEILRAALAGAVERAIIDAEQPA